MQQTDQYKLNLIESGDAFSAAPLNENAEKLEEALAEQAEALETAKTEQAAALAEVENTHAQDIAALTAGAVKIATGTYTGKGTYGSSNKNTLTFEFEPKLIVVMGSTCCGFFIGGFGNGLGYNYTNTSSGNRLVQTVAWSGNSVSWYISKVNGSDGVYSNTAAAQFNSSSVTYSYVAIG